MPQPAAIVTRPSLGGTLREHRNRLRGTESPFPGKWVYVLPIAPATPPPDLVPDDPLAPIFQNGWGNNAGDQAVSFRIHPATHLEIRGGIQGGALGTVVFTLPAGFRPMLSVPVLFPANDGLSVFTGRVDPNGDVTIIAEIAGGAPPTPPALTIAKAQYSGNPLTIANGAQAYLTWDTLASGTELLDRSTPQFPVVLADGVYQLVVQIAASGMTAGGFAFIQAQLTGSPMGGSESDAYFPAQLVPVGISPGSATILVPMLAGDSVGVSVSNLDGAVSRDFYIFDADLIKVSV